MWCYQLPFEDQNAEKNAPIAGVQKKTPVPEKQRHAGKKLKKSVANRK